MSGTLPLSTATQETTLETVSDALTIDPGSEDFKSSPNASAPLSNGIEAGKTKLAIRKPPPPVQAKPSRFLKKSLTLSSLPRLGNKSSNSRLKESKEENGEENSTAVVFLPTNMQESKGKRESSIWKIPTLKKNRRHSAIHTDEVSSITIVEPRLATTPPETHKNILTSTTAPPRELPPLPTIPPLGVPLPTEGQNETQIETDQNLASHNAAEVQSMATNADVGDVNTSSISGDDARAQSDSSFSHSIESLPQAASVPQSTSTPKSAHSFTPNSQFEKADASDTIQSLIEKYSKCVPLRIRVLQGYCSDTADINISTGDLYDVQVMKTTKVVTIRDQDGMTYRVPLESMMKFGLVFNLSSNYDEGLCGYTFRTVSDLTSLSILPRVVCTVRALKGNDARSSVQENEILVVQQAIKSMFRGKRGIKVYSVTANIEKVLPEDCDVGFSTNPSLVRLQLSDIINHISYPFPAHAVMYPSAENVDEDIPGTLSRVITMLDYSTKQSLIVSSVVGENDGTATDESAFFEIPLDDDMKEIEVSVLKWTTPPESPQISAMNDGDRVNPDSNSYSDDDHVYDDTVNLIQTSDTLRSLAENRRGSNGFGSISGRSSPGVHMSGTPPHLPDKPKWLTQHTQHIMQSDTNAIAHSTGGRETAVTGSIKYDNIPPTLPVARSTERIVPIPQASVEEDPGYDTVGIHLLRRGGADGDLTGYNKLHYDGYDGSEGGDPRILPWMEDLQSATNNIESRLLSLERTHNNVIMKTAESSEMTKMQTVLEQLAQKVDSLDAQLHLLTASTVKGPSANSSDPEGSQQTQDGVDELASKKESNKTYLKSLDIQKVCELIEAMGLGQYKKSFSTERVSGEILLECDDQVLQDELGIKSRIHRIRLTKVITGLHSAKSILEQNGE